MLVACYHKAKDNNFPVEVIEFWFEQIKKRNLSVNKPKSKTHPKRIK